MDIIILGATGSIGTQTFMVAEGLPDIRVRAFTVNTKIERAAELAARFKPEAIGVADDQAAAALRQRLEAMGNPCKDLTILTGAAGLEACAAWPGAETVVNALAGGAGLAPTMAAIKAGKHVALANKESLVTAGQLIMEAAQQQNVRITPVDSEHSAIMQCLQGNEGNTIEKIILTASGGPFRTWTLEAIACATATDALRHPTWLMGPKITIDCATMMNKGLEVIEAMWLFGVGVDRVSVLVHPQSVVHSMVAFADKAVMAQLGTPDMRVPIQYALTAPKRLPNHNPPPPLDLTAVGTLTFEEPDTDRFPCLALALQAARTGGTLPAVMNTVNEMAVTAFLHDSVGFYDISRLIEAAFDAHTVRPLTSYEDVVEAEQWARAFIKAHYVGF